MPALKMDCTSEQQLRIRSQVKEKCGNRVIKVILEPVKLNKVHLNSIPTRSPIGLSNSGSSSGDNSSNDPNESGNSAEQEAGSGQSDVSVKSDSDAKIMSCTDSDETNVFRSKTSRHRRTRQLQNYAKCVFSSSEESDADLESQPISKINPKKSNLNSHSKTSLASVPSINNSRSQIESRPRNLKPKQAATCEICSKKYSSVPLLEAHILANHVMDNPFECDVCYKAFISKRKLTQHFQTHCNKSSTDFPYICSKIKCIFVCKTKNELKLHFSNTHINIANNEGSSHFCPFCNTLFENDTNFQEHLKVLTKLLKCRICPESADSEKLEMDTQCNLNQHVRDKHPKEKKAIVKTQVTQIKDGSLTAGDPDGVQKCPVCVAHLPYRPDLTYQENLDKHQCLKLPSQPREPDKKNSSLINTHHCDSRPVKLLKPKPDPVSTFANVNLKPGTQTSLKSTSDFICLVCGVSFSRRSELNIHEKLEDHKRWKCPACPKLLKNKYSLKVHLATIHSDARPVKCEHADCDKAFKNRRELLRHRMVHLGSGSEKISKHKCNECAKSFMNPASLRQHLATYHCGERPFRCPECPKAYAISWDLKVHSVSHSDERPFPCKYCDKRFRTVTAANTHIIRDCKNNKNGTIITGAVQCDVCQKRFASVYLLKQHSAVHTDQRPFPCKFCDATYKALAEARRHEKKCEGLSPAERRKSAKLSKQVLNSIERKRKKIITGNKGSTGKVADGDSVSSSIISGTDTKFRAKQEVESNSSDSDPDIFVENHSVGKILLEKVPKLEEEK